MEFMSLAISFMAKSSFEKLLDIFSESTLSALIIITIFIVIPLHILGIVLLARGCSARAKEGRTAHAVALQCIGVILLLPVLLSVVLQPISFFVSLFFIIFA